MTDAAGEFPVSRCAPCGRDVLVHTILDANDRERIRCVGCDAEIDPLAVRWVDERALVELGYGLGGEVGVAGCGRPGCGGGRCGRAPGPDRASEARERGTAT